MNIRKLGEALKNEFISYCSGKDYIFRSLLLVFYGYLVYQYHNDYTYTSIFGALNLGIHELGHFVFMALTNVEIWIAAGGTILQIFVPLVFIGLFAYQRDYFAHGFVFVWLATNLFHVSVYMGDARALALPLVSIGGGDVYHDWRFIFLELNCLHKDTLFAGYVKNIAFLCLWLGVLWSIFLIWGMIRFRKKNRM
jgi:hypothetical protein